MGAAHRIAGLKKAAMVQEAEAVLDGTGWLPAALRVPAATCPLDSADAEALTIPVAPIATE